MSLPEKPQQMELYVFFSHANVQKPTMRSCEHVSEPQTADAAESRSLYTAWGFFAGPAAARLFLATSEFPIPSDCQSLRQQGLFKGKKKSRP